MKKTKNKLLKATASVRGKSSNSGSGHNMKGEGSNYQQSKRNKAVTSPSGTSLLLSGSQEVTDTSPVDKPPHSPFSFTTFNAKSSSPFYLHNNNKNDKDGVSNEQSLEMVDPKDGINMFHNSPTKSDANIATLSFPDEWTVQRSEPQSKVSDEDVLQRSNNKNKYVTNNCVKSAVHNVGGSSKNKNNSIIPPRMKSAKGLLSPIATAKKKLQNGSINSDETGAFPTLPSKSRLANSVSDSNHKATTLTQNTQKIKIDDDVQWDPHAPVFSNVGSPQSSESQKNDAISFSGILDSFDDEDIFKDGAETTNVVWEQRKDWSQDDTLVKPQQHPPNNVKLLPSRTDNANSEYAKRMRREKKDFLSRSNTSPRKMKIQIQELIEENKNLKRDKLDMEKKIQQKHSSSDAGSNESSINPLPNNPSALSTSEKSETNSSSPHNIHAEVIEKNTKTTSEECVTEARGDSSKMQQTINKLNQTIIQLQDSNKETEQSRLRLERENRALKEEAEITLVYLQQELSTALKNVEDADLSRSRDQDRIQDLTAQLNNLKEESQKYAHFEEERSRFIEEKQKNNDKVKEYTSQLEEAKAMIASKTEEVEKSRKELSDYQKNEQRDALILADLKLELDNANKMVEEDSNRNALEKQALRTENEILMKQNKLLENNLNIFKLELNDLKMKHDQTVAVDNNNSMSKDESDKLKKDVLEYERQLTEKETKMTDMKTEFGTLIALIEEKLLALETENKELRESKKSSGNDNKATLTGEGVGIIYSEVQFNELREKNESLVKEIAAMKSSKASTISNENPPNDTQSKNDHNQNDEGEENLHDVFSIPASKSETGERTSEDKIAGTLVSSSTQDKTSLPVTKQNNRRQTGNKRWQAMSVGITEAQLRAKDLQVENLQRAAKINEETIKSLENDVATANRKIEEIEKAHEEKVNELTKENIACTYKLTVLEKVRKMELARVGKSSANLYDTEESEEPNAPETDIHEVKADKSEEKIDEACNTDASTKSVREESPASVEEKTLESSEGKTSNEGNDSEPTTDEIEQVVHERKFTDESMHVLVAKIVALEKEKEASLEKIDSLQLLIDAMYERERNEKEEKMLYIEHLRDEISSRSSEVTSLQKELQSIRNGEKVSGEKNVIDSAKNGDNSEQFQLQSMGNRMLPGLLRRINGGSKHGGGNSIHSMNNDVASDDPAVQKLKRTCRIQEQSIASLTSEVNSLRLVLKTESSKHEIERENMKAEAELSASKVSILEEQFINLNKLQENWLSDMCATGAESKHETKQSIISLDAAYVSGLKDDLAEQKDLVDTLNVQIEQMKKESKELEQKLRNDINSLKEAKREGEDELRSQILAIVESKKVEEAELQMKVQAREATIATLEKSLKQLMECNQNSNKQRRIHTSSEMGLIVEESSESVSEEPQTTSSDSYLAVNSDSKLGDHNNDETDVSKLQSTISQLKQIEEELVSELEEKEVGISKMQRKISMLENKIKDSIITEKSSVLSLRRVGLIQELLDASIRRLNTMMNKLGRDQMKENTADTEIENDPKLVLSVADKVSLLQEQLKVSVQFVELKLANELESIRRAKRGEGENVTVEEVSQVHLQRSIEIQKETTDVLKSTEKALGKQIEEVNQEMKSFNLALLSKDDVIERLNNAVNEKTLELQSIEIKFDVLKSSCKDGEVVTEDLFQKVTEGIEANRALQEKERTIQRLNNVINDYRTRLDALEQDENLQDGNDENSIVE